MRDKVRLKVSKGKAIIEEGGDSVLGTILAGKKLKVNSPLLKGELRVEVAKPVKKRAKAKK